MKVLVCGNINSGKSTAIEKIKKILPSYTVLSIDDIRKQFGDGTILGEELARKEFVKTVLNTSNCLVELSGMGAVGIELEKALAQKSFIILQINETPEICIKRIVDKNFSQTPYPKFSESLPDTITRIDKEFKSGALKALWGNKAVRIIQIDNYNKLLAVPFLHYEKAIEIFAVLLADKEITEIITYGSFGRGDITIRSDVDFFITTDYTVNTVKEIISKQTSPSFIDTTKNMVTAYYDDILIEIAVCKNINDNILFYQTSDIQDISSTIIKGNSKTAAALKKAIKDYRVDIQSEIDETIRRLVYFVISLKRVANCNDDYKFFFHNNIIIHEFVRLSYFSGENTSKNYLPPKAFDYCDKDIIKNLTYNFGDNRKKHIKKVKMVVSELLTKIGRYEKYARVLNK